MISVYSSEHVFSNDVMCKNGKEKDYLTKHTQSVFKKTKKYSKPYNCYNY